MPIDGVPIRPFAVLTKMRRHLTANKKLPTIIQVFDDFFSIRRMKRVVWNRESSTGLVVRIQHDFHVKLNWEFLGD